MSTTLEDNGSKRGFCKTVSKMEEQCCNLDFQYRFLTTKINAMEKSIPALLAFQLLNSNDDISVCNILDVINAISPYPDPSDKLARSICKSKKKISDQVKNYHEKIIKAEFELEEINAEINNLNCVNEELRRKISNLQEKLSKDDNLSLHSINSEELECLKKIRKLAENELCMKNRMKELETREAVLRDQMAQLLVTKNFQPDKCSCVKSQNRNNGPGSKATCDCMAAAKKLFSEDDKNPNFNHFRHQSCRTAASKYQSHFHTNRPYMTNSHQLYQSNATGSRTGTPCMCCKCDLGDIEINIAPTEPKKSNENEVSNKETLENENILQKTVKSTPTEPEKSNENDVSNEETPKNENTLQEVGQSTEDAPSFDIVNKVENIEKGNNEIREEIPNHERNDEENVENPEN